MVDSIRSAFAAAPVQRLREVAHPAKAAAPEAPRASLPQLVSMASELAQQGPPFDYARIAQLRAAIADGSYQVDVKTIASAMVGRGKGG